MGIKVQVCSRILKKTLDGNLEMQILFALVIIPVSEEPWIELGKL